LGSSIDITWNLEPHTKAKHEILKNYLNAWFPILASKNKRILYVDGFAGPGEYSNNEDGSPIIALKAAKDHMHNRSILNRSEIIFYFIEQDEARHSNLKKKIDELDLPNNIKTFTECNTFECAFGNVLDYIQKQNTQLAPSFVFIDPFGPTGFPMSLIESLSQQRSSEVLINFNYRSLNQWFLLDDKKHIHLNELYNNNDWHSALSIQDPKDKEQYLRETYKDALEKLGWKVRPFKMMNTQNQTEYYLFFATSNYLGMLVMKGAMWKAAPLGDFKYSDLSNPQQACLFETIYEDEYSKDLAFNIFEKYKGKLVRKEEIIKNVLAWHPICITKHLTKALKLLEDEDNPKIINVSVPDRRRRANSFPDDCSIQFTS